MQLKYILLELLLVSATSCVDENRLLDRIEYSNEIQIQVTEITVSDPGDSTVATRGVSKETLDLTDMPIGSLVLDNKYILVAHVMDQYIATSVQTRGTPIRTANSLPSMGIAVYNSKDANYDNASTAAWKRAQAVNIDLTGSWSILGEAITWPLDINKLTFLAFSPSPSTASGLVWPAEGRTVEYTVPATITNQPDLCVATPIENRTNLAGSNNHVVTFALQHALTAITIKASGHQLRVISAIIKNAKIKGTLDLYKKAVDWSNVTTKAERALSVNERIDSPTLIDITKPDGHLMMIPQTLEDDAILEFVFEDQSVSPYREVKKSIRLKTLISAWAPGKQVFYNLQLKSEYNLTVSPTQINVPAQSGSYETLVYSTNATQTPTVSVNQGWITSLVVNAGKITFNYSANSSAAKRTATLTVTSGLTTKTVKVVQESATPPVS